MTLRQRIMDILEREHLTTQQKLVGIILLIHANKDGMAWPSTATIQKLASVKRNTVFEAAAALEQCELIERELRGGKRTQYRFLPLKVVDEIVAAYEERKAAQGAADKSDGPVSQTDQYPKPTSIPNGPVSETDQYPKRTRPVSQTYQTSIPNAPARLTTTELPTELSHTRPMSEFANEHVDARWTDDGRIEVLNGFRTELAETFPHVDMKLALIQVAAETHVRADLKKAILKKFSLIEQIERGKDRRYKAAVSSNKKPAQQTFKR